MSILANRRNFLTGLLASGALTRSSRAQANPPLPTEADLVIERTRVVIDGRPQWATAVNGTVPGPTLRFREGDEVTLRVRNALPHDSSIHWHGLLVPPEMDGVPGVSFAGIPPGETFTYRFRLRQSGTYWYHSHSGFQEQTGVYGALIVEPADSAGVEADHPIVLSDWTSVRPERIYRNLKRYGGYYNLQRRTLANLAQEEPGAVADRLRWSRMRMDATDLSDVTGAAYTYLMNGHASADNWTGLVQPGQEVRLRFINAGAATTFDVRIPGVEMTVVAADGMPVEPVPTDEFRLGIAETLDVVITPPDGPCTIFAEAMDRSGFVRGTLSRAHGDEGVVPERRPRPLLTMNDMGMDHGAMDHGAMDHGAMDHGAMDHGAMNHGAMDTCTESAPSYRHDEDHHGPGNAMVAAVATSRPEDPGPGLRDAPWRVLTYSQLRWPTAAASPRPPDREIELHLTGNMERYMWAFDGQPYRPGMPDIRLRAGERVRFVLINDTMMNHPIHLHGMFFELEVGHCGRNPLKHTVNVKPAERVSFVVDAVEVGRWAFHCHILYHMDAGMFRVVEVAP